MRRATPFLILVVLVACATPTPTPTPTLTPTFTPEPTATSTATPQPTATTTPTPKPTVTPTPVRVSFPAFTPIPTPNPMDYIDCNDQAVMDGFEETVKGLGGAFDSFIFKLDPDSMETVKNTSEEIHCKAKVEVSPIGNSNVRPDQLYLISRISKESGIARFEFLESGLVSTPTPEPISTPTDGLATYAGQFCSFMSVFIALEEMAEADLTWGEALPHLQDANEEFKKAQPPVGLVDFHQAVLWLSDTIVMVVESKTPWKGIDDDDSDFDSVLDRGLSRMDNALAELSEDAQMAVRFWLYYECEDFRDIA